jgi:hypothetical protein
VGTKASRSRVKKAELLMLSDHGEIHCICHRLRKRAIQSAVTWRNDAEQYG